MLTTLLHLQRDGKIIVYKMNNKDKQIINSWELEKLLRTIKISEHNDTITDNVFFEIIDKGCKEIGYFKQVPKQWVLGCK